MLQFFFFFFCVFHFCSTLVLAFNFFISFSMNIHSYVPRFQVPSSKCRKICALSEWMDGWQLERSCMKMGVSVWIAFSIIIIIFFFSLIISLDEMVLFRWFRTLNWPESCSRFTKCMVYTRHYSFAFFLLEIRSTFSWFVWWWVYGSSQFHHTPYSRWTHLLWN